MKFTLISITLALSTALSFSQTILKNSSLQKTDTAYCVSIKDIKLYNHAIADLDACNELADSLYSQVKNQEVSIKQKGLIILDDNLIISKLEGQIKEKSITEESYIKEAKKNNNKVKLFKGLLNLVSSIAIVELGIITILYVK